MTAAVIDVGSNSVLLLVARVAHGTVETIDRGLATTRLGSGLVTGGSLDAAARARTTSAVVALAARARAAGAERVWAFATGAARRAADGAGFAAALASAAGCPVEIVDGDTEARLAWDAAVDGLAPAHGVRAVVDVGGATTEIAWGEGATPDRVVSLPLGALALHERFGADAAAIDAAVAAALAGAAVGPPLRAPGLALIASGGTATALAALDLGLAVYDPVRVHGHVLARSAIDALVVRVAGAADAPGLDPARAAILPAGARVLAGLMDAGGIAAVRVSDRGVRHAYLRARLAADGVILPAGAPPP